LCYDGKYSKDYRWQWLIFTTTTTTTTTADADADAAPANSNNNNAIKNLNLYYERALLRASRSVRETPDCRQ
jgi:hypothetical protein